MSLLTHLSGAAISLVLLSACASPVEGLWPPSPDSPARTIFVSLDTWHAMIAFPLEPSAIRHQLSAAGEQEQSGSSSPPSYQLSAVRHSLFEEWGYAERAWYLEDKRGLTGIARVGNWG